MYRNNSIFRLIAPETDRNVPFVQSQHLAAFFCPLALSTTPSILFGFEETVTRQQTSISLSSRNSGFILPSYDCVSSVACFRYGSRGYEKFTMRITEPVPSLGANTGAKCLCRNGGFAVNETCTPPASWRGGDVIHLYLAAFSIADFATAGHTKRLSTTSSTRVGPWKQSAALYHHLVKKHDGRFDHFSHAHKI